MKKKRTLARKLGDKGFTRLVLIGWFWILVYPLIVNLSDYLVLFYCITIPLMIFSTCVARFCKTDKYFKNKDDPQSDE